MGMRYKRAIKLGHGKHSSRVNIGTKSIGVSAGIGPIRQCYSTTGRKTTTVRTGIPGLYYQTSSSAKPASANSTHGYSYEKTSNGCIIGGVLFCLTVFLATIVSCILPVLLPYALAVCVGSFVLWCAITKASDKDYSKFIDGRPVTEESYKEFLDWYHNNY